MRASLLITCAMLCAACWSHRPSSDSRSNWLRECTSQRQCGDGLACVCGVCTRPCYGDATCGGGPKAICVDPARDGIAASCAEAVIGDAVGICLPACSGGDECPDGTRCVEGVCLDGAFLDDGAGPDAPGDDPAAADASSPGADGGDRPPILRPPAVPPADASLPDTDPPPLACTSTLRDCCLHDGRCGDGLVCHIDQTCIVPGMPDENGVATIAAPFPTTDLLHAIDGQFAYGTRHGDRWSGSGQLVRWSLAGTGSDVLTGTLRLPASTIRMRVDNERLYFLAAADSTDRRTLFSMPKDGSAAPAPHGLAGAHLVDDAEHVYVSDDGDSRIARIAKSRLTGNAVREPVFRSATDMPGTIIALAVNSTHLFVAEARPMGDSTGFAIHRIDKATLVAEELADDSRFTVSIPHDPPYLPMFASDGYVLVAPYKVDRLDLATFEVTPVLRDDVSYVLRPTLTGDDFYYFWYGHLEVDSGVDREPMSTGQPSELLADRGFRFGTMVASPAGLFVAIDDGSLLRLVHVTR